MKIEDINSIFLKSITGSKIEPGTLVRSTSEENKGIGIIVSCDHIHPVALNLQFQCKVFWSRKEKLQFFDIETDSRVIVPVMIGNEALKKMLYT